MPDFSDLEALDPAPRDPEDGPAPPKGGRPPVSGVSYRLAPAPRGVIAPRQGHVYDPEMVRSLRISGDGWLNRDGRVVSDGGFSSYEALLEIPEMAAIMADIAAKNEALRKKVREIHDAARARWAASWIHRTDTNSTSTPTFTPTTTSSR